MIRKMMTGALALLASAALVQADAKSDVKAAGDKLAAAPNYTLTTDTTSAGGGQGFGNGKTVVKFDKNGYTMITSPGFGGNGDMQIAVKGEKVALKMQDQWQTADEMAQGMGGGGGGFNIGAMIANRFKDPVGQSVKQIDKVTDFKQDGDAYTGTLAGADAKAAMAMGGGRGGQGPTYSDDTKISYKFWIANGMISKVETHTTGTVSFGGNDNPVDRTATTTVSDVGSTTVDVPAEAKTKLDAPAAAPQQ